MKLIDTYYIKRRGIRIWLSCGYLPKDGDKLLEIRKMLVADSHKVITREGVVVGKAVWIGDNDINDYSETDEPIEEIDEFNEDIQEEQYD